MSQGGLQKTSVKGIELAYVKPGATLASYKRVKIDPVEVAFHPSWDPKKTGSNLKVSASERQEILDGVAKLVQEEFAREIQAKAATSSRTNRATTSCASRSTSSTCTCRRPRPAAPRGVRAPTSSRPVK